jgi:uncharacterized protein YqeY
MNLKEKINNDLKSALKQGDKLKLETIRSIRALILEYEKSGKGTDMSTEDELQILTSAAKKRKEAIEQYLKAERKDLAEKEEKELAVIQNYLPAQLSDEDLRSAVKKIAEEIGAVDKSSFGKLMGAAVKRLRGQADGNDIRQAVEKILA